jgi:Phasin protein
MYSAKGADMTKGIDGESSSNIAQLCTCDPPDSAVTANMLAIVAEVTDYSKQYLDNRAAFVEKLLGAKSVASAVQIQSEYARTSFAGFVAQATKMAELYSNLAKSASIGLDWRWPTPK